MYTPDEFIGLDLDANGPYYKVARFVRQIGTHRMELNIRPENTSSRAVAEKVGYREEGFREKYLHINGDWRDHVTYVLLAGDLPAGVVAGLRAATRH